MHYVNIFVLEIVRHSQPKIIKRFESTGSVKVVKRTARSRPVRSHENIEAVRISIAANPSTSTRHRSQELHISRSSLNRILHKDLYLHAYKIQLVQYLSPNDFTRRLEFANWVAEKEQNDANVLDRVIFSDESHFLLNGRVNKQNCRIWGTEQLHAIEEKAAYPQYVSVWCRFWTVFFPIERSRSISVNGVCYREMINKFLIVISKKGEIDWPPRSCELTPMDFFLWGFLKDRAYVNHPQTIDVLKAEIKRVIQEIKPVMTLNIIKNLHKRLQFCQRNHGAHLNEIIYHQ